MVSPLMLTGTAIASRAPDRAANAGAARRPEESDEVAGLQIGADDYVTKPFSMKVLMARVETIFRRTRTAEPGVLDSVPKAFVESLAEPAFDMADTTFCVWQLQGEPAWCRGEIEFPTGNDPDGSGSLLRYYDGKPGTYRKHGADYFEADVPLAIIRAVYAHQPLSAEMMEALNPDVTLRVMADDLAEIGYPPV